MRTATDPKAGRNAPCPCGSGRKRKRCCGARDAGSAPREAALLPLPSAGAPSAPAAAPSPDATPGAGATPLLLGATFVLAFCSIVYELLLGQTLSAFLGNTVLRYSVTIGLYMLSMGMGALLAGPRILGRPVIALQGVEVLLTAIGAGSVPLLFAADAAGVPAAAQSVLAHGIIVVVGLLSGAEIPLLLEIRGTRSESGAGEILAVDYAGAFAGTVAFALWFYPRLGLLPTAFLVASLNGVTGLLLSRFGGRVAPGGRPLHRRLLLIQAVLLAASAAALLFSAAISEAGIALYLGD